MALAVSLTEHYAFQTYLEVQSLLGPERAVDFATFLTLFAPHVSKHFGVPVANMVTLHVRLNPLCSVHTRLSVNVDSPQWYSSLCQELKVDALTTRNGKPISACNVKELRQLDSVLVQTSTKVPIKGPIASPLQYSPTRMNENHQWFQDALQQVAYHVGDVVFHQIPTSISDLSRVDEVAWQSMVEFINNKKHMQNVIGGGIDSLEHGPTLSPQTRNELMNLVYKGLVQTVAHHQDDFAEIILQSTIDALPTEPTATVVGAELSVEDADLFGGSAALSLTTEVTSVPIASDAIRNALVDKVKKLHAKRKAKAAQRKADKAKDNTKTAQDKAEREAKRAAEKSEKAKEELERRKAAEKAKKKEKNTHAESTVGTVMGNLIVEYCSPRALLHLATSLSSAPAPSAPTPAPTPVRAPIIATKATVSSMPTLRAVEALAAPVKTQTLHNHLGNSAPPVKPQVLTREALHTNFGKSHQLALKYISTLPATRWPAGDLYLYSDKQLEPMGSSLATIKQSLSKGSTNVTSSFSVDGRTMHVVN